jgi:hypothetical protein
MFVGEAMARLERRTERQLGFFVTHQSGQEKRPSLLTFGDYYIGTV